MTWTRDTVAARIREARDTLRRVPAERIQGVMSGWPPHLQDIVDGLAGGERVVRLAPASPRAIDRMHEVFGWFIHLQDQPHLTTALWLMAGIGLGPTRAGAVLGVHRDTARTRRNDALDIIVRALNAKAVRVA